MWLINSIIFTVFSTFINRDLNVAYCLQDLNAHTGQPNPADYNSPLCAVNFI